MSIIFYHPFEEHLCMFPLFDFKLAFNIFKFKTLEIKLFLFGFGLIIWWSADEYSHEYETFLIEPEIYKGIFSLTKYESLIIIDDVGEIRNDYNQLYYFTNDASYILKPKIK